jgi:hypothetical protein
MSHDQLLVLLTGLSYEGHIEDLFNPHEVAGWYEAPEFQSVYQDALTTLVLLGQARVPLPQYLAESIIAEPLIKEELLDLVIGEDVPDIRSSVTRLYERCFGLSRRLESNPASSTMKYLDDRSGPSMGNRIDAATDVSELDYSHRQLAKYVEPLANGVLDIFGSYWESRMEHMYGVLEDLNSDYLDLAGEPLALGSGAGFYNAMGIGVRSGLRLQDGIAYTPSLMSQMEEIDRLLGMRADFDDEVQVAMLLNSIGGINPKDFIAVHSYWSTFFGLLHTLRLAEDSSCPVMLPSDVAVTPNNTRPKSITPDLLRVYRVYLSESGLLPTPRTFNDALRLREDSRLRSLRRALDRWHAGYAAGQDEAELVQEIRKEITAANAVTGGLEDLAKIGSLVSYVSLPIGIADAINGSLTALFLAPIGPAIETYRLLKLRRFGWVKFGR